MSTEDDQSTSSGCTTCDLEGIEDLACTAKRFARQAEVMNSVAGELDGYKTQFEDARQKFSDAKETAKADIDTIKEILEPLKDQLKCRLTPEQRECMKKMRDEVFKEIDECTGPRGCCLTPCDEEPGGESGQDSPAQQTQPTQQAQQTGEQTEPAEPSPDDELAEVIAEIARLTAIVKANTDCFKKLIGEPKNITDTTAKLKQQATDLDGAVSKGGDETKAKRWYATWLVLHTSIAWDRISGFKSASEYIKCLCEVLQCLMSGWTKLAELEGTKAELECKADGRKKLCDKKKDDPMQAVLDRYDDCCKDEGGEEPPEPQNKPSQDTPGQTAPGRGEEAKPEGDQAS